MIGFRAKRILKKTNETRKIQKSRSLSKKKKKKKKKTKTNGLNIVTRINSLHTAVDGQLAKRKKYLVLSVELTFHS